MPTTSLEWSDLGRYCSIPCTALYHILNDLSGCLGVLAFRDLQLTSQPHQFYYRVPSVDKVPSANPPRHVHDIYVLWFCGLGMSLSSAGLATLAQSWIQRYMIMTQPRQGPRGRRIRAYVRLEGSLNSLQLTVDFLHLLLDGSIFTFLAGLIVLLPLKRTNFGGFLAITIIIFPLSLLYLNLSLISFFRHTIYSTPTSRLIRNIRQATRLILPFRNFHFKSSPDPRSNSFLRFDWATLESADQVAEKLTKAETLLLEKKILEWLIRCLHDDKEFEQFLESIYGFYHSDLEKEPAEVFWSFHKDRVPRAILSFMHRTLFSATLPDDIKRRRIRVSLEAIKLDPYLLERTFFHVLSLPAKPTIFQCIDFVLFANQFAGDTNASSDLQLLAKCTIALAIYQSPYGPRARPPLAPHR